LNLTHYFPSLKVTGNGFFTYAEEWNPAVGVSLDLWVSIYDKVRDRQKSPRPAEPDGGPRVLK